MAIKEPEDKFLRFQRSMIVLLSRPKALTSDDFSKIEAVLKIKRGSVGISREFSSLNGTHKAYEEAVAAADIGSRVDGKNRIYSYDEFLPFVLIRKCAQAEDILKYVMPGLIELAAEDKRQGTEMMKTVRNYLKNGRSLRKVSE
ncbi:MAG: hypothetical protein HGA22_15140, partial [Clostridiales bacterium]|nr:hypothetical protein [Clostridiales bacterium]